VGGRGGVEARMLSKKVKATVAMSSSATRIYPSCSSDLM
jgi:hypothetical protein